MKTADRAKQFLPFDALRGYYDIINKVTRERCERKYLDEEGINLLNQKLMCLKKGMLVTVIYYLNEEYVSTTGLISRIDKYNGFIDVVKERINIKDIFDIEGDDIVIDYYSDI